MAPLARFCWRLRRLARFVAGASDRRRERQALAELDDRLLADIGLTAAERDRECRRLPWDWSDRR